MTELTVKQFAAIKRIAMNVAPLTVKKARLQNKIALLQKEIAEIQTLIDAQQGPVMNMAGGMTTEMLVTRVDNKYTFNPATVAFDEERHMYQVLDGTDNDIDTPDAAPATQAEDEPAETEETQLLKEIDEAVKEFPMAEEKEDAFPVNLPETPDVEEAPEEEAEEEPEEASEVTATEAPEFSESNTTFDPFAFN
jgi:hypothetical protein